MRNKILPIFFGGGFWEFYSGNFLKFAKFLANSLLRIIFNVLPKIDWFLNFFNFELNFARFTFLTNKINDQESLR
jgi:hypothetical protein